MVPAATSEDYYQGVLQVALAVGLKGPDFLLGLLWHAPHGEAHHLPDRLKELRGLVAAALAPVPVRPGSEPLVPQTVAAGSVTNFLAQHLATESLETTPGIGAALTRPGPDVEAAGQARFDQSLSGQFFQLLAGLGEKVISESCRYEAVLSGLGSKKAELEGILTDWQQSITSPMPPPPEGTRPDSISGRPAPSNSNGLRR